MVPGIADAVLVILFVYGEAISMAQTDARLASAGSQDSAKRKWRSRPSIAGYAKQLSHPAYERLLSSENLLRKLVPVLIVLFLVVVALARWVQINSMGQQIIEANKAELHFIVELVETKLSAQVTKTPESMPEYALQNLLSDNVPARYLKKNRNIVLSDVDGIIRATLPHRSELHGQHLHSKFDNAFLLSRFGRQADTQYVTVDGTEHALGVHRHLPGPYGLSLIHI